MDIRIANIVASLEKVADSCESRGLMKEAFDLDVIANTLEREADSGVNVINMLPPGGKALAKELGISNLSPEEAGKLMKQYYPGSGAKLSFNVDAALKDKTRNLALLATMIGALVGATQPAEAAKKFTPQEEQTIEQVKEMGEVKGPITVEFNGKETTYDQDALDKLKRSDLASWAVVQLKAKDKEQKGEKVQKIRQRTEERAKKSPKMDSDFKAVKDSERLSDDFGNTAMLITYQDGTKELKDDILQGGVSLRKMLEDKGEIAKGGGEYAKK